MTFTRHRIISAAVLFLMTVSLVSTPYSSFAGNPSDDLKQIEYRYYFRGRYQQAIEALQTYLARVDLTSTDTTRGREVLAASYVLGGAPAMGKEVFSQLIVADPAYPGPDPTVFKLEVVNTYAQARSEYAVRMLKTAPAPDAALAADGASNPVAEPAGKPIYKKWWLYAGAVALLLVVGAAAGDAGGETTTPPASGSVAVGVRVQ